MKRKLFAIGLALTLALIAVLPVWAGGWSVVTLDELPGQITAGQPVEIGFMVLQHGKTPLDGLTPIITARLDSGKPITFAAEEEGETGHYVATLTFPQEGQWEWEIAAFGEPQTMLALTVFSAPVTVSQPEPVQSPLEPAISPVSLITGVTGLTGIVLGLLFFRNRKSWAVALVVAGLLVGGYGVVSAASQPEVKEEAKPVVAAPSTSEISQVELGRQLFIAKGCITCHYHSDVQGYSTYGFDDFPNLTNFTASAEYLRMWLKDPNSVKPAKMPALGLSDVEIEALIAFINAE